MGPLSSGYCRNCNEQKKFENSVAQFTWAGRLQKEYEDEEKEKEDKEELETFSLRSEVTHAVRTRSTQ